MLGTEHLKKNESKLGARTAASARIEGVKFNCTNPPVGKGEKKKRTKQAKK